MVDVVIGKRFNMSLEEMASKKHPPTCMDAEQHGM